LRPADEREYDLCVEGTRWLTSWQRRERKTDDVALGVSLSRTVLGTSGPETLSGGCSDLRFRLQLPGGTIAADDVDPKRREAS
jgi:hypothetical protein